MNCSMNLFWFVEYQYKMAQYKNVNVRLSNWQLKLKSATKWWKYFSNDDAIFPLELLLTDRQILIHQLISNYQNLVYLK